MRCLFHLERDQGTDQVFDLLSWRRRRDPQVRLIRYTGYIDVSIEAMETSFFAKNL